MNSENKIGLNSSFVIVGAGAAGLTAARLLVDAGYQNITVIEASGQAGGKCKSFEVGNLKLDLGAIVGAECLYQPVLALSEKHGIATQAIDYAFLNLDSRRICNSSDAGVDARLVWEGMKYIALRISHRHSLRRGHMTKLHPSLCLNYSELAKKFGLEQFEIRTRPIFMGMGYGYSESLPAAYVANFLTVPYLREHVVQKPTLIWQEGTQKIWQCEAAELQTRGVRFHYNTLVRKINRDAGVQLLLDQGEVLNCDELIVACDPRMVQLDYTDAERRIFSAIKNVDYRVLVCRINGLPDAASPTSYFIEENLHPDRVGHPMVLVRKYPQENLYLAYVFGGGRSEQEIKSQCSADVNRFGASVAEYLHYQEWRNYFPHFEAASLRAGVLDDIQKLQGKRNTTYVGEWMTFAMLPRVIELTESVINQLLARQN